MNEDKKLKHPTFERFVVIYREGVKAFNHSSFSGLQLDGTLIKMLEEFY
jgi:hypothetical protein